MTNRKERRAARRPKQTEDIIPTQEQEKRVLDRMHRMEEEIVRLVAQLPQEWTDDREAIACVASGFMTEAIGLFSRAGLEPMGIAEAVADFVTQYEKGLVRMGADIAAPLPDIFVLLPGDPTTGDPSPSRGQT